jgi:hypothetical protein
MPMAADRRIQLQLRIPYKFQPTWHREVRRRLEQGWRIEDYARLSDEEVAVTMVAGDAS